MKDIKVQFAKDGITVEKVIVGENHYQVTLITPTEQELKPVEGKWYRRVKEGSYHEFSVGKWYQYGNHGFNSLGQNSGAWRLFDLSTPLDFDPETLVGKEVKFEGWDRFYKIESVKGELFKVSFKNRLHAYDLAMFHSTKHELRTPEPTLTVPDSVEFVMWGGSFALRYNGLTLSSKDGEEQNFTLESGLDYLDPEKNLKLIPCKLEEVNNGEWVVLKDYINQPNCYILATSIGAVYFEGKHTPIKIEPFNDKHWRKKDWLKVVQG